MDHHAYRDIGSQTSNPGAAYGQQNANMLNTVGVAPQVTLTGQINSAHSLLDSLGVLVADLEKKLSPVLSSNYPEGNQKGEAVSCEPPALEEMDRLLNRLSSVCAYVSSIHNRTRI